MFLYKSRKELLHYLGQLDGLIQLNEIALQHFKSACPTDLELRNNLEYWSKIIRVKVSYSKWPDFFDRYYREQLVSVYSAFEKFYDQYRKELKTLFQKQCPKIEDEENKKLNRLIFAYKKISELINDKKLNQKDEEKISSSIIDLFEYYHSLRTTVVHPERYNPEKAINIYKKLNISEYEKEFNAKPSEPGKINFEDYLLYSKTIKRIAVELTDIMPSEESIISLLPSKLINQRSSKKEKQITEYLRRNYGLDKNEITLILGKVNK